MDPDWRCISYLKWWFSIAIVSIYWRVCAKKNIVPCGGVDIHPITFLFSKPLGWIPDISQVEDLQKAKERPGLFFFVRMVFLEEVWSRGYISSYFKRSYVIYVTYFFPAKLDWVFETECIFCVGYKLCQTHVIFSVRFLNIACVYWGVHGSDRN